MGGVRERDLDGDRVPRLSGAEREHLAWMMINGLTLGLILAAGDDASEAGSWPWTSIFGLIAVALVWSYLSLARWLISNRL